MNMGYLKSDLSQLKHKKPSLFPLNGTSIVLPNEVHNIMYGSFPPHIILQIAVIVYCDRVEGNPFLL